MDPVRTPVVVAAGQVCDRERTLGAFELLVEGARCALSASPALGRRIQLVSVVNILARSGGPAPARRLAGALALRPERCETTTVGGNAPQWLVQRAAQAIAAGRLDACLVAGAEAVRSGRLRPQAAAGAPPAGAPPAGAPSAPEPSRPEPPEDVVGDNRAGSSPEETAAGLYIPAFVYPVFENVLAARAGRSPAEQRAHVAGFLTRFTGVAARQDAAWFRSPRSAGELATPCPENRIVAEPYTKLMTAFLGGSQAAALVVTSLQVARELHLDDGAMFVRSSASLEDVWEPAARPDLGASPAIAVATRAALDAGGLGLDEIGLVDLYSCFPSAVQIGAAAVGLALDDPRGLTVTGGLPYFGGPGSNYTAHAIATVFELLRERGGHALVSALGWYLTKHSVGCYSATPPPTPFRAGDTRQAAARIEASALPVVRLGERLARTPAEVAGGTVVYGRDGAVTAAPVVATLDDGRRAAAAADPAELPTLAGVNPTWRRVELDGDPPRWRTA